MISKLRSFSNSKIAGVIVGIIIIPFVFWGMGSVFSGGNTNNVAKIDNEAISSKDFVNFIKSKEIKMIQTLALNNNNVSDITNNNLGTKNLFADLGIFLIEK